MRILCWMGLHSWRSIAPSRYVIRAPNNRILNRCLRCGKVR